MKKSRFTKKPYQELIANAVLKQLAKLEAKKQKEGKVSIKPRKPLKRGKLGVTGRVKTLKRKIEVHWKPPAWFNIIPYGSHGSGPVQKRLWKFTSDYVRIRDWEAWDGRCVSSDNKLESWRDGDCGHFKRWTSCNSYFKFNPLNLALQSKGDNSNGDGMVGYRFAEEMKRRYGANFVEIVEKMNKDNHGGKLDPIVLVQMAEDLIFSMKKLSDKPDYYEKMMDTYLGL